jgi:hypothetical protein
MYFYPDDDSKDDAKDGKGDPPEKNDEKDPDLDGLGDAGKAALAKIRGERDAEKRRAKDLEAERDALKKTVDDAAAKEIADQEEAAKKKGEFEQLAEKRGNELKAANETITSLQAQVDRLKSAIDKAIEPEWKELPDEVTDLFSGAEDDTIAKMEWLPKAKTAAAALDKNGDRRGHELDPDPAKGDRKPLEEEIAVQLQRVGAAW